MLTWSEAPASWSPRTPLISGAIPERLGLATAGQSASVSQADLERLPDRADAVVIGLGLMGAAATLALARRGHTVVALDAHSAGHRQGSSHGSSRIFRRAYLEPDYVRMSGQALGLWRRLEHESSSTLLVTTGGLDHLPGHGVRPLLEVLTSNGVPCSLLTSVEGQRRWPQLRLAGEVVHHSQAGVIDPEAAMAVMLHLASASGAQVLHEARVRALEQHPGEVTVKLAGRTLCAKRAVVAVGPWTPQFLAGVVKLPPLTVTQQSVFHFVRRDSADDSLWPTVVHSVGRLVYGLQGGRDGTIAGNMKLAEHAPGPVTTADGRDGVVDSATRCRMVDYVRHWWPGLDPEPVAEYSCLYTRTADEDFVIDRYGDLVVCSACSGHGPSSRPWSGSGWPTYSRARAYPMDVSRGLNSSLSRTRLPVGDARCCGRHRCCSGHEDLKQLLR